MDIGLFGERATSLDIDLLAVVKECVGEGGRDRREREPVAHGEGQGKEERAVTLVSLEVERRVCIDDPGDVVYSAGIIKGARGKQGKVSAVPNVRVLRAEDSESKHATKQGVSRREWVRGASRKRRQRSRRWLRPTKGRQGEIR